MADVTGMDTRRTRNENSNLLLPDLCMPGGIDVDVLRKLEHTQGTPVMIVFTNLSHEHYRILCMTHGVSFFVDKSGNTKI